MDDKQGNEEDDHGDEEEGEDTKNTNMRMPTNNAQLQHEDKEGNQDGEQGDEGDDHNNHAKDGDQVKGKMMNKRRGKTTTPKTLVGGG